MSISLDRRRGIGFGTEQFPHKPSRKIKETVFVTCQQCGFAVDTTRAAHSKSAPGLPQEGVGCGLCGSLYWAPYKPKLKDGNDTDAKRSDRRRLR